MEANSSFWSAFVTSICNGLFTRLFIRAKCSSKRCNWSAWCWMSFLVTAANELSSCSSNKHIHKWPVQAVDVNSGIHLHHLQLEIDIVYVIARQPLRFLRVNEIHTSCTFAAQIANSLNGMKVLKRKGEQSKRMKTFINAKGRTSPDW